MAKKTNQATGELFLSFLASFEDHDPHTIGLVARCIASRGKRRGLLLKSAPKASNEVVGTWRALASEVNNPGAGIFAVIFASDDERSAFFRMRALLDSRRSISAAAWALLTEPFGFDLQDMHRDRAAIVEAVRHAVEAE